MTDAWFGPHADWSQFVPLDEAYGEGRPGVLGWLRALPSSRVATLHANVRAARARLQYAMSVPAELDAVDVIVENLSRHGSGEAANTMSFHEALTKHVCT